MLKTKRILHWIYMLSPALLTFVVYSRISTELMLFEKIPIPRWSFLAAAIIYILMIGWFILVRLSIVDDFEEADYEDGIRRYSIAESLHYTTTELIVCLLGMVYMDVLHFCIPSWSSVASFYGWVVLILYGTPFILSLISIFSVRTPKPGQYVVESNETYEKISRFLWVSGLIAMFVSMCNIALSLWLSSMAVCIFSYFLLIPAIAFEWIYLRKSLKKIWSDDIIEVSEEERKERIQ